MYNYTTFDGDTYISYLQGQNVSKKPFNGESKQYHFCQQIQKDGL